MDVFGTQGSSLCTAVTVRRRFAGPAYHLDGRRFEALLHGPLRREREPPRFLTHAWCCDDAGPARTDQDS